MARFLGAALTLTLSQRERGWMPVQSPCCARTPAFNSLSRWERAGVRGTAKSRAAISNRELRDIAEPALPGR